MATSLIKRRQDAERTRQAIFEATLRRVSKAPRVPPNFFRALQDAAQGFEGWTVREPSAWRPNLKTRDPARLCLAAARHLFARYPVAAPLESIWVNREGLTDSEVKLRKHWYIVAARGGSLYKECANGWLSRKEAHAFLNAPDGLGFDEALWFAIAKSYAPDDGIALRLARSKVGRTARSEIAFWREVMRFFCMNPAPTELVDDLCDYMAECLRRDAAYSLKGRTLATMRRQMHEWHRDLAAIERIEAAIRRARGIRAGAEVNTADNGRWSGASIADWSWRPSAKEAQFKREEYAVCQLRTAEALVAETRAMRHCVSTYAAKCVAGKASIWSLRRYVQNGFDRLLTIEVDPHNRAIQVRGACNRLAKPDEKAVLERWAKARNIVMR
jgi:PcfJ-like protein